LQIKVLGRPNVAGTFAQNIRNILNRSGGSALIVVNQNRHNFRVSRLNSETVFLISHRKSNKNFCEMFTDSRLNLAEFSAAAIWFKLFPIAESCSKISPKSFFSSLFRTSVLFKNFATKSLEVLMSKFAEIALICSASSGVHRTRKALENFTFGGSICSVSVVISLFIIQFSCEAARTNALAFGESALAVRGFLP
jgi:hypothetical protein